MLLEFWQIWCRDHCLGKPVPVPKQGYSLFLIPQCSTVIPSVVRTWFLLEDTSFLESKFYLLPTISVSVFYPVTIIAFSTSQSPLLLEVVLRVTNLTDMDGDRLGSLPRLKFVLQLVPMRGKLQKRTCLH